MKPKQIKIYRWEWCDHIEVWDDTNQKIIYSGADEGRGVPVEAWNKVLELLECGVSIEWIDDTAPRNVLP